MATSTFVGRVEPLDTLQRALASATAGLPQVVVIEAPPGMGKSALLNAFSQRLDHAHQLWASGDEDESTMSFGLLEQLLQVSRTWADPFTAGATFLQHVGRLTGSRPVVIMVDDAQFADLVSLQAVSFMVRRLRADPVLLVLAYRPEQVHRLPTGLTHWPEKGGARIVLERLTETEIQDLSVALGVGRLTSRAATRLRHHTAGNPLHLRGLLRELTLEELQAVEQPLPAPRSFASLVLSGLAAASPAARAVVTAACVLGEHATVGDVLVIAEIGSVDAVAAFEELTQLGILSLRAGDAEVHFTHPLVRAAVYDDLGPGARCRLHERAARMQSRMAALRHRATATIGSDSALAADLESEGRAQ